jgi:hypothetical protein
MKKSCSVTRLAMILLLGFAVIAIAAEQTNDRRYTLSGHGVFQMKVPASWKDEVQESTDYRLPPRIALRPASGDQFIISIIPFWKESEDAPTITDATARRMVKSAADKAQPNAAEKTLTIIEMQGASGSGYYFSATAKAPEPGSAKYMTQGILLVGELTVSFVIFTNDGQKDVDSAALAMLKGAVHVKEK